MEEFFAEVDENDTVLAVHSKEKLKEVKFRHRVVLVLPKTDEGKIILGKRAKEKFPFPGIWCCALGGKVRANESYEEAVVREMKEEIGMNLEVEEVAISKLDLVQEKAIAKIFTTKEGAVLEQFKLDPSEIEYCRSFTVNEILSLIEKEPNSFAPTFIRHFKVFAEAWKLK